MGQEYKFNCDECGFDGQGMDGAGESGRVESYFCLKCSMVTEKWSDHVFKVPREKDENLDRLVKEIMAEYIKETKLNEHKQLTNEIDSTSRVFDEEEKEKEELEEELKCEKCDSSELKKLEFKEKMKCPRCNSKKFNFGVYADWD
jgi:hypothetical protein